MYLQREEILALKGSGDLVISPTLSLEQIGEMTIDLRLGYDFLVSIQGREAFMDGSLNNDETARSFNTFFHKTRRRPGETFLLHPHQAILGVTLEYLRLPKNICLILNMRSSYARLGLSLSTIVQPGYTGCLSIELINSGKNAINLTVGARIFQARLVKMEYESNYFSSERKYMCQVRPEVSAVNSDKDLMILNKYWQSLNNRG
ncbi:dCTP deaminase [Roseivirga seohaensis]|uniref:dCTP deaminase n=1 Tax=Roseivirga seohaensis TaxID=1914963 RepID=A0A150XZP7_9BACT|nr:dCTP deaminase [Roseivirga seohaensis]KYG84148.1 dCTP deaminase [Roseivirga seohaensis]